MLSAYEIYLELQEISISRGLIHAWNFCFAVLIAMWAVEDSKQRGMGRYMGFGLLVLLFWPLVLLYHMPKTRGVEGIVSYVGFWGLYSAPFFLGLTAYSYS
jgi:hypothetical protein